jgi:hypothetical protein
MSKKKQYPLRRNIAPALVLPFLPYILGGVVVVGVGMYAKKYVEDSPKVGALLSAPTLFGAGSAFLGARVAKLDNTMTGAATLMGGVLGWALQYYVLSSVDAKMQQKSAEAAQAQREADFRWYNPLSWAGTEA